MTSKAELSSSLSSSPFYFFPFLSMMMLVVEIKINEVQNKKSILMVPFTHWLLILGNISLSLNINNYKN